MSSTTKNTTKEEIVDEKSEKSEPAIKIDNITKIFEVADGQEVAVDNFNLDIGEDEFITIVGPSGCGKTTTLRCIAGLETPTEGSIMSDGKDLTNFPPNKRNIAMMFQSIALYPHMKVRKNIAYPLLVRNSKKNIDNEIEKAARMMQIEDMLNKYPGELSGGQQQRAALARTVVQQPDLFLMDEPLSDLDAKLKAEMRKEIQRIHQKAEIPTVYVTHDQKEALTMSDRIVVMNDGHIAQVGPPDELYDLPNSDYVARFIGNPTMNFLYGVLDTNGSSSNISVDNVEEQIQIERNYQYEKLDIKIGIRPQNIEVCSSQNEGIIKCEINLIERIDNRELLTLESPVGEILAFAPPEMSLSVDDTISITFDPADIHLFDKERGKNLDI